MIRVEQIPSRPPLSKLDCGGQPQTTQTQTHTRVDESHGARERGNLRHGFLELNWDKGCKPVGSPLPVSLSLPPFPLILGLFLSLTLLRLFFPSPSRKQTIFRISAVARCPRHRLLSPSVQLAMARFHPFRASIALQSSYHILDIHQMTFHSSISKSFCCCYYFVGVSDDHLPNNATPTRLLNIHWRGARKNGFRL